MFSRSFGQWTDDRYVCPRTVRCLRGDGLRRRRGIECVFAVGFRHGSFLRE